MEIKKIKNYSRKRSASDFGLQELPSSKQRERASTLGIDEFFDTRKATVLKTQESGLQQEQIKMLKGEIAVNRLVVGSFHCITATTIREHSDPTTTRTQI